MLRCRRLLVARLASGASLGLRTALVAEDPCAVKLFRWQEDCRNLRGRAAALGARPGELCRTRPSSRWRGSGWRAEASARARDRAGPIAAYSVSGSPGGAISMATVIGWLEHVGVTFVFLFVLLEQAGLPLPAYPLLIIAGAWSAQGGAPYASITAVAVAACLIADLGWYVTGRRLSSRVLPAMFKLHLETDSCGSEPEGTSSAFAAPGLLLAKFGHRDGAVANAMSECR